jgi:hypothetical protein
MLPEEYNLIGSHVSRKSCPNSRKVDEKWRLSDIPSRVRNKLYNKAIHEGFDGKRLEAQ